VKILIYSDLHLEFGDNFRIPSDCKADVLILAGDIITFANFEPLHELLEDWHKPVLFVAGNHEYYTKKPLSKMKSNFIEYIKQHKENITFLDNSSCTIGDVEFFGGTMWTDFDNENPNAMLDAQFAMNDFKLIYGVDNKPITPLDTTAYHYWFKKAVTYWLENNKEKKRVVISHHAPCLNPNSKFKGSKLQPAFNSLDMLEVIEKYQPNFWVYGHSHECDNQKIGNCQIVSNQRGYQHQLCQEFNERFCIEI